MDHDIFHGSPERARLHRLDRSLFARLRTSSGSARDAADFDVPGEAEVRAKRLGEA
jgi:hypothetical protein